jgi:hypothetical protein
MFERPPKTSLVFWKTAHSAGSYFMGAVYTAPWLTYARRAGRTLWFFHWLNIA